MTPQDIADRAAALGFDVTLCDDGTVLLNEEVWTMSSEPQDEVWERYEQIRAYLRKRGMDLPLGLATLEHDHISGAVLEHTP